MSSQPRKSVVLDSPFILGRLYALGHFSFTLPFGASRGFEPALSIPETRIVEIEGEINAIQEMLRLGSAGNALETALFARAAIAREVGSAQPQG